MLTLTDVARWIDETNRVRRTEDDVFSSDQRTQSLISVSSKEACPGGSQSEEMVTGSSTGRLRGAGRVFGVLQRWQRRHLKHLFSSTELTQIPLLAHEDLFVEKASGRNAAGMEPFRWSRERRSQAVCEASVEKEADALLLSRLLPTKCQKAV